VAEGDVLFSPRLAGFVLDAFRDSPTVPSVDPEFDQLTPREREVLRLLARGLSNRAIGKQLYISETTAKFHVCNIMRKLEVTRRAEAVYVASKDGII